MNDILFAFQSYNNDFDCYNPNTHPKDNIVNGKKTIPLTHGSLFFDSSSINYDIDICKKYTYDEFAKNKVKIADHNYLNNYVKHTLLDNLTDTKYLYPIMIADAEYFTAYKDIGFKYVDKKVIDDVRQNKAKIVFIFPYEGHTGFSNDEFTANIGYKFLNNWCKEYNLNKNNVYFIHGNLLGDQLTQDYNFTLIPVDCFINWVPSDEAINDSVLTQFNPIDNQYLYLCYNRAIRLHRKILLSELINQDLFNSGLISIGEKISFNQMQFFLKNDNSHRLYHSALSLSSLSPKSLDMNLKVNNPANHLNLEHYERTFISVIPETHFVSTIMFRSEKIYKTIAAKHPFIVIGSKHFLKSLKKSGYKTFDKWIDESYDDIDDLETRILMACNELKKLSNYSINQLKDMRIEMEDVLIHNKQLFKQNFIENSKMPFGRYAIFKIIKQIWDTF